MVIDLPLNFLLSLRRKSDFYISYYFIFASSPVWAGERLIYLVNRFTSSCLKQVTR